MQVPVGETTIHVTRNRILLALAAFAIIGYGGYDYVQQSDAIEEAVAVQATIEDAGVVEYDGGRRSGIDYAPQVEYTYRYRGERYSSDRLTPSVFVLEYDTRSEAESVADRYEPGTTVTAYVTPDDPGDAFLMDRRTGGYLQFLAIGGFVLLLTVLDGLGSQTPGRSTELRPADEVHSARSETLFGLGRDTVHRLARRLMPVSVAALLLSMVALVGLLLAVAGGSEGRPVSIQADLLGPFGIVLLVGFVSYVGLVGSVALYGAWSFTEYRHLRERLHEPRPPSPFRHPARLVTIIRTDSEKLTQYGRRVRLTGVAFVIVAFLVLCLGVVLY
jgi:hypothetical protein